MPFWFFALIIKDRTTSVFCMYSLFFTLLHKTCGMILTVYKKISSRLCKNCVSHFLCYEKNAKTCNCLYLLLCHNKIAIDERLNGFIVRIVLFYDLLSIHCADLRSSETGGYLAKTSIYFSKKCVRR